SPHARVGNCQASNRKALHESAGLFAVCGSRNNAVTTYRLQDRLAKSHPADNRLPDYGTGCTACDGLSLGSFYPTSSSLASVVNLPAASIKSIIFPLFKSVAQLRHLMRISSN
ncbi:hypothetical protein, partial [Atlantibacter sp.]|uniref:hypothetical protein n=1 Tax=Atlantibacter sp. TaxID=1903473 RepID=UPI0028AB5D61